MPRERKPTGDYEVGYGRPPKHTRFRPGQSGNPKGRRKGVRNLKGVLEEELFRPITVQEGGRRRTVPILAVVVRQALAKAAKGETRALTPLLPIIQRAGLVEGGEIAEAVAQLPLSVDEEADLREALAEWRAERPGPDPSEPAPLEPDTEAPR
ncbi:DUF5681 domain-containing protein [Methylobacterium sp. NEAU 140]|uniref:DUF5681 domain-containing protein n=1 Tax=Methylobacterium sp. NEAU 140 TaxID=3064945 RepID=UPI00273384EF|nr:DUF5681 domain-containing protein [Methylobacterium sp. NEAU 140]MDP4026661.1 DUF5681 domain-containing protein [Methylobacterium sp. NEAU 140]